MPWKREDTEQINSGSTLSGRAKVILQVRYPWQAREDARKISA
jgi:hypothetical protein